MRSLNIKLAIAAAVLLLLSAWTYHDSVQRAERFERGQDFLPNLNPDEIAEVEIRKGADTTLLRRNADGDRFTVESEGGYWAENSSVNRFIKDVLEMSLEKKIGSGESLEKDLELVSPGSEGAPETTTEIAFKGSSGGDMVRFLIGKALDGGGSYVQRIDGEEKTVYLTDKRVYLSTDAEGFLEKEILDVSKDKVTSIQGADFQFSTGEDGESPLALVDLPSGQKESSQASQVMTVLQGLRFTQHFLANDPTVQGLVFDRQLEILLEDGSGYVLQSADKGDKHYLRLEGFHTAGRITIAQDASDEEVKETSEVLERADELQKFNAFHGSWIYEVTPNTADRVRANRSDLLEDA